MKKMLLLSAVCVCLFGCGEPKNGPYVVKNTTSDTVAVSVSAETYADQTYSLSGNTEWNTGIDYYTPSVQVIKSLADTAIRDNKYYAQRSGFTVFVQASPENTYFIQNEIPAGVYSAGSQKLFLIENNNKMGRYYDPSDIEKLELVSGTDTDCTIYTDMPSFKLVSEAGEENKLNGYSVSIVSVTDNVILIR